jgi:hypothetical protein
VKVIPHKDLSFLIKDLKPSLHVGEYVFCQITSSTTISIDNAVMLFKEAEGVTVICLKQYADKMQWPYTLICAWITLTVHSDLSAVGLTAAFSRALSDEHISCNVVAAYHHDHIFVPFHDADRAMQILQRLSL